MMKRAWWSWVVAVGLVACGGLVSGEEGTPPVNVGEQPPEEVTPEPPPQHEQGPTVPPRQPPAPDAGQPPAPDGGSVPERPPPTPEAPRPFRFPPLQTEVPLYELSIPEETLARFEADPYLDEQPATFTFQGRSQPVGVRLRGSSARFWPKKSWRIEFPKGVKFNGRRKHNLIAEYQDATLMVEKLGYDLLAAMGVPAPRARYVRLKINGVYQGVFLDLERVDKDFLDAHDFADDDASIYRCGAKDCEMKLWRTAYQSRWNKKTNEHEPSDALWELLEAINHTPEPELPRVLEERLELEHYLRVMVMDAFISLHVHQDGQSYLIHDRHTGRWSYVPWDLNNADMRWWPSYGLSARPITRHPLFGYSVTDAWMTKLYEKRRHRVPDLLPSFSNLNSRIALNPVLRERLCRLIERALDELYAPDVILPRLEALHALLLPYVAQDPYLTREGDENRPSGVTGLEQFHAGLPYLKRSTQKRAEFLRQELRRYRSEPSGLILSAFDPRGGWVELRNEGTSTVSTRGLVLTQNLRRALRRNVPARSVPPGGTVRFTAAELGLTDAPLPETGGEPGFPLKGELGLFTGDSIAGMMDALFYGELPPGRRYIRGAGGQWEVR